MDDYYSTMMNDDYNSIGNDHDKTKILLNIANNKAASYADSISSNKTKKGVNFDVSERGSIKPSVVKYLPSGTKRYNAINNYNAPSTKVEKLKELGNQRIEEQNEDSLEKYKEEKKNKQMKEVYGRQVNPNLTRDTKRNTDSVRHMRNIFDGTRKAGKRLSKKTKRNRKTKSKRKH